VLDFRDQQTHLRAVAFMACIEADALHPGVDAGSR
jgi:hypothetical protein